MVFGPYDALELVGFILRALGAELILTDPTEGSDGAILMARQLAVEKPDLYWYANQYNNPANWRSHFETTGPEIIAQTGGAVTHFVAGLGTSGTFVGTGRALKWFSTPTSFFSSSSRSSSLFFGCSARSGLGMC